MPKVITGYSNRTKLVPESFIDMIEQTYLFLVVVVAPPPEKPLVMVSTWPLLTSLDSSLLRTFLLVCQGGSYSTSVINANNYKYWPFAAITRHKEGILGIAISVSTVINAE